MIIRSLTSRRFVALLLAGAVTSIAVATHELSAQPAQRSFSGTYVLRRSRSVDAEAQTRRATVLSATAKMEPSVATKWRAMIEIMSFPEARLEISNAQGEVSIVRGERAALKSPESGQSRTLTGGHELSQQLEGGALVQRISTRAIQGAPLETPLQIISHHTLSADQRTMTVETRFEGGALPQPITFQATYDRL